MIAYPPRIEPTSIMINMRSPECLGMFIRALSGSVPASVTNVQNLAWFYPFRLTETTTFVKGYVYNGATVNGNWDVGIYDASGTRLGSTGAVAQATVNILQSASLTANVTLGPGKYYMGMSSSSATATFFAITVTAIVARLGGVSQMAAAHVLPTPATLAAMSQTIMPEFGISQRSLVF